MLGEHFTVPLSWVRTSYIEVETLNPLRYLLEVSKFIDVVNHEVQTLF